VLAEIYNFAWCSGGCYVVMSGRIWKPSGTAIYYAQVVLDESYFMEKYKNKLLNRKPLVFAKPVLGFAAYSGTGKTTLLVKLLPLMKLQGLRVAIIKQSHHDFDIDKPGKDSFEFRKAGANQVLIASEIRCALMTEYEKPVESDLVVLVNKLDLENIDLVVVEGFKYTAFPKIELHRAAVANKLIFPEDDNVIAVASDVSIDTGDLPLLNLNETEEVAGFINRWLNNQLNQNLLKSSL
jgi:molybdopterin-guanine dinucleotide biosynthesis protein MobB